MHQKCINSLIALTKCLENRCDGYPHPSLFRRSLFCKIWNACETRVFFTLTPALLERLKLFDKHTISHWEAHWMNECFLTIVRHFSSWWENLSLGILAVPGPQPGQEFLIWGQLAAVLVHDLWCIRHSLPRPCLTQRELAQHPCSVGGRGSGKLDGAQVTGLKSFEGLDDLDRVHPRSLLIPKIGIRTFSPYMTL